MPEAADYLIVLTTVADREQAALLARGAVEQHLAACVTCLPGAVSYFRWEGDAVGEEPEVLLLFKTHRHQLPALREYVLAAHPYDVPEFLALVPAEISPAYRAWLDQELVATPRA